jgi:4-hydroxy-tetrahydrodipicolinate synthase
MPLTGLFVPLITPFTRTDELAADALETLAAGLVALGTTAEAATLTGAERRTVVEICADVCARRGAPLVVGAGSSSTAASVGEVAALDTRAAAALAVVPYYTRPSAAGVVEHFRRLADASPVPLLVYNVPHRTGLDLDADTLGQLARVPNVIGFKHAVGQIDDTTVRFMSQVPEEVTVLAAATTYTARRSWRWAPPARSSPAPMWRPVRMPS